MAQKQFLHNERVVDYWDQTRTGFILYVSHGPDIILTIQWDDKTKQDIRALDFEWSPHYLVWALL